MGPIRAPPPLTITEPTIVIVSAKKTINRSSILDDLPLITNRTQFALYCKRQSKSLLLIWLRNVLILGLSVLYISCFLKLIIPSRKPTLQPLRSSSAPFLRLLVPSACLLWLDSIWALVHGITITDHFLTLFFLTLIGVVAVIIFSRRVEREIIVLHSLSKSLLIYRQNAMGLTSIQLLCPNDIMDIFIIEAFVGCTARYLLTLRLKGKTPSQTPVFLPLHDRLSLLSQVVLFEGLYPPLSQLILARQALRDELGLRSVGMRPNNLVSEDYSAS